MARLYPLPLVSRCGPDSLPALQFVFGAEPVYVPYGFATVEDAGAGRVQFGSEEAGMLARGDSLPRLVVHFT